MARPAIPFPVLKERLDARLKWLGVKVGRCRRGGLEARLNWLGVKVGRCRKGGARSTAQVARGQGG